MKLYRTIVLLLLSCFMFSCIKSPSGYRGDDSDDDPKPVTVDYRDVRLQSFNILPDDNLHIYGVVSLTADESGQNWQATITGYQTDLSALKANFNAVAASVKVGEVEQLSGETVNDFTKKVIYKLYASDGRYKEYSITLTNSGYTGLPILGVVSKVKSSLITREEWFEGRVVLDPQQDTTCKEIASAMEIKGRGHNSWSQSKKPYNLKLESKKGMMGMNSNKRWTLLANASDRTLLRNRVSYEIGRRTELAWTPDTRFVDVVMNGLYAGSYLLAEQIRVGAQRVNIAEMKATDIEGEALTGGYLLEFDRYYDEVNKFRTTLRDLPVNIKEPDEEVLQPQQKQYITDYVNHVESLLYAAAQPDPTYTDYLDINSFADWWIVMELCHNRDTRLPGSCHMYKDRNGKLCAGPLWDFDLTTFASSSLFLLKDYETDNTNTMETNRSLWYKRLFMDPRFVACVKQQWAKYKASFATIPNYIDTEAAKLKTSADINWSIWTLSANINHDESLSWQQAVEQMKANYSARLSWLDQQIQNL